MYSKRKFTPFRPTWEIVKPSDVVLYRKISGFPNQTAQRITAPNIVQIFGSGMYDSSAETYAEFTSNAPNNFLVIIDNVSIVGVDRLTIVGGTINFSKNPPARVVAARNLGLSTKFKMFGDVPSLGFFKKAYVGVPVWGWTLGVVAALTGGVLIVRTLRKSGRRK